MRKRIKVLKIPQEQDDEQAYSTLSKTDITSQISKQLPLFEIQNNISQQLKDVIYSEQGHVQLHISQMQKISQIINNFEKKQHTQENQAIITIGKEGIGKSSAILKELQKLPYKMIRMKAQPINFIKIFQQILGRQILKCEGCKKMSFLSFKQAIKKQKHKKYIIFIDDIDKLIQKNHCKEFYQYLSIFNGQNGAFLLIGQTNQFEFVDQIHNNQQYSFLKFHTVLFKQITIENTRKIIQNKIERINSLFQKLNSKAQLTYNVGIMSYFTQKVFQASKGNIRIILKYLWQYICSLQIKQQSSPISMNINEVKRIFQEQKGGFKVQSLQIRTQIGLISLYTYFKSTQNLTVTYSKLMEEINWVEASLSFYKSDLFQDTVRDLQLYGLIKIRPGKQIQLKINLSEIEKAFGNHPIFKKFIQTKMQ